MKMHILATGLLLTTVGTVLVYPTIRSDAAAVPPQPVAPLPAPAPTAARRIEAVFVLDTTGSMGGLIQAAKEKIWSIASTLAQAQQAPEIAMGLVAYRDRGDAYVTRIVDLDRDLDSMYVRLMDFAAEGGGDGPEAVNEALDAAINRISWSSDPGTYRVVFLVGDAPPHMDYQDDVKYPELVAAAAARGIVINTIQCGNMRETVAPWQHIATLGRGRYFTVEQSGGAVAIATPFDAEIATLAAALDETRLSYGTDEEQAAFAAKAAATERLRSDSSVSALARRGAFNASSSGAANLAGEKDLVADVVGGRVDLATIEPATLPPAIAALPPDAREEAVAAVAARREELRQRIADLAAQRDAFIEDELEKRGGAADSLDQQIYDAVREQAAPLGFSYDGGPKF